MALRATLHYNILKGVASMKKRYCKMQRKANGKAMEIRDRQVTLDLPLPIVVVLMGMPEVVEKLQHGWNYPQ
jgi:hypothetical protein